MRKKKKKRIYRHCHDLATASEVSTHTDRSENSEKSIQRCSSKYGDTPKFQFNVKVRENYIYAIVQQ